MKQACISLIQSLLARFRLKLHRPAKALLETPEGELEPSVALLLEAFAFREKRSPFILQIGANDGKDNDPLHRVLTRYGWPALLMEPQPDVFRRLTENYLGEKNVQLINCAIADHDGAGKLYRLHRDFHQYYPHRPDGLASFSAKHVLKHLPPNQRIPEALSAIEVNLRSFSSIYLEYAITQVDALVIDTEGFDWDILELFDVPLRLPSIIQYEWQHLGWPLVEESLAFLIKNGYQVRFVKTDVLAFRADASCRQDLVTNGHQKDFR